jgi:hypothetical protein
MTIINAPECDELRALMAQVVEMIPYGPGSNVQRRVGRIIAGFPLDPRIGEPWTEPLALRRQG